MDEKETKIKKSKKSTKQVQYFSERFKKIIIPFDELLGNPEFVEYNDFELTVGKKRVFNIMAEYICKENNEILNFIDPDIRDNLLYNIFCIKLAINEGRFVKRNRDNEIEAIRDFGKYENFINVVTSNLFNVRTIAEFRKYIELKYAEVKDRLQLEKVVKPTKNNNKYYDGTTFTDEHFVLIYMASALIRFVIPLCTHYIHVNSDKTIDVFRFMFTVFDSIFKLIVVDTNCVSLLNKLTQFIERIVVKTENTNKTLWDSLPMYNNTKEKVINDLLIKMVTIILPKISFEKSEDGNPISLISVVARDTVERYILRAKHPFDAYRINDNDYSGDDEDSLSESDIFDLYYRPQDESQMIFKKYCNFDAIIQIQHREGISISDEELDFYMKNVQVHQFNVMMVSQVFAPYFKGANNVRSCTREEFVRLVIILVKKMRIFGIDHIQQYITGKRESYSFTRMPNKTLLNTLKNNIDYVYIVENKYRHVKNIFTSKINEKDPKNPIKDIIAMLIHNNYTHINFEHPELNGTEIEKYDDAIIRDILKVYRLLII